MLTFGIVYVSLMMMTIVFFITVFYYYHVNEFNITSKDSIMATAIVLLSPFVIITVIVTLFFEYLDENFDDYAVLIKGKKCD